MNEAPALIKDTQRMKRDVREMAVSYPPSLRRDRAPDALIR